jgi:hypothetical protein
MRFNLNCPTDLWSAWAVIRPILPNCSNLLQSSNHNITTPHQKQNCTYKAKQSLWFSPPKNSILHKRSASQIITQSLSAFFWFVFEQNIKNQTGNRTMILPPEKRKKFEHSPAFWPHLIFYSYFYKRKEEETSPTNPTQKPGMNACYMSFTQSWLELCGTGGDKTFTSK